ACNPPNSSLTTFHDRNARHLPTTYSERSVTAFTKMGAAISLPLLSAFALPAFTSYGTSVNLLFFTLNWYILLLMHPPLQVELIGVGLVQLLLYLLPAVIFLLFDTGVPSVAVQIKTHGELALAGRKGRNQIVKIAAWSIFNVLLGAAVLGSVETLSERVLQVRTALNLSKTMPMPWKIAKSVALLLVIRGFLQYYIHRHVLHNPRFRYLSKAHATWQHSIPSPFSLIASYDHPICYLLHHWVPLYTPAFALHVHILPFLLALSVSCIEELITYSGYSIMPSGIILPGMARRTDNHFLCRGDGNYAAFGALDWVNGTSVGGDVADDMKAEWEKHGGQRSLGEAGNKAGGFIDGIGSQLSGKGGRKKKETR
ncbi:SulP family sulfate permease, partial [Tothia fuscella]